jgi:putative two-component system response regulator
LRSGLPRCPAGPKGGILIPDQPGARILVVDDLAANVALVRRFLDDVFRIAACSDPLRVPSLVEEDPPDAILMDVRMPGTDGFTLCRTLKQDPRTMLIPIVLMTASTVPEDRLQAIDAGADDFVTKPLNREELRARLRSLVRVKRYTDELEHAEQVIVSLAMTIEARDAYTEGHCQRLGKYTVALGRAMHLSSDDLSALERGGYLHDIGKIAIPDGILMKPGSLTPDEFALMKQHPVVGERLCGELRSLRRVHPIIRHHHEKLDGSGYPDGLRGDQIPLLAQITSVADVYDALTTDRPYRAALTPADACEELRAEVRRGWRREAIVEAFIREIGGGLSAAER